MFVKILSEKSLKILVAEDKLDVVPQEKKISSLN